MNKTFPRSLSQGMLVELHMNLVKHFMALSFCHVLIVFVFHVVDILYITVMFGCPLLQYRDTLQDKIQ